MIPAVQSIEDTVKTWRNMLIKQTGLSSDRVLNAMSVRGANLSKRLTEFVSTSISLKDCVIVFSLHNRYEDSSISQLSDDKLESVVNLELKLVIYGDASLQLAEIIKARIESEKCRTDLYAAGIYFQRFAALEEINEFLNDTAWHRTDMSIDFQVMLSNNQIDDNFEFENTEVQIEDVAN